MDLQMLQSFLCCIDLYTYCKKNTSVSTFLLMAKALLKQITLPRLELCAAHFMDELMLKVKDALHFDSILTYGWTELTVVLS